MYKAITEKTILCFLLLGLFHSCQVEDSIRERDKDVKTGYSPSVSLVTDYREKGIIKVKLSPSIGDDIRFRKKAELVQSNVSELNVLLTDISAKEMTRVFPHAGKYEGRTRREGLHLWYEIRFDEKFSIDAVLQAAQKTKGIQIVEDVYRIQLPAYRTSPSPQQVLGESEAEYFNDPRLKFQWHYNNNGNWGEKGADINLYKAWEKETGKPNVIVAIVDGGIDVDHEDLKDNMHVNLAEKNGETGVDDDGNGYIDDIYGYNFVNNTGRIIARKHGTHVAGTVAARNNNGLGVAGVAGGNGTPDSGVRLISCQIFVDKKSAGAENAIKYGADNGAVISQNSWGYPYPGPGYLYPSLKEAIDYFIKYAGCDDNGEQLPNSPMKGGVVVFAAGNDNKEFYAYPAAYEKVVSVSAMAPDFKKAHYSNYAKWIDIMAPGGDAFYPKGRVLSTVPGNNYEYLQGTSMACPHVSGIAALIVSKYGKTGFTNSELLIRLLKALRPVDINKKNPDYKGKLGAGYIDAYRALGENKNKKPENPSFIEITPDFTELELKWKAVADEDDDIPYMYRLYYSKTALNKTNYSQAEYMEVSAIGYNVGDTISYSLRKLDLNTKYYLAIVAIDRWNLISEVDFSEGKTKENHAPEIKREDMTPIKLTEDEVFTLKLKVEEPDGQEWNYEIIGDEKGVTHSKEGDYIVLKFRVVEPLGKYRLKVTVTDPFNATDILDIPFEYYQNEAPRLVRKFETLYAPVNKSQKIDLSEYFIDGEGQAITYSLKIGNTDILGASVEGSILTITSKKPGIGTIKLIARDTDGAATKTNIQIQAVNDDIVYVAWPIPVMRKLNLRLSDEVDVAKISIRTTTGSFVLEEDVVIKNNDRLIVLNLSEFSGGTYILYVEANGKTFKQSFVKY